MSAVGASQGEEDLSVATAGLINEAGKNAVEVKCRRCSSKLLTANAAQYKETQYVIPLMKKKPQMSESPESVLEGDSLSQFWTVDDIYKFENMGFSNTVNDTKYLVCADCEIGPLGLHDLQTKISYLALQRVTHE